MVIDTSAIVAILHDEPERDGFARRLDECTLPRMSAVTRVELTCVLEGRGGDMGRALLEQFLAEAAIEVVPVDAEQVRIACEAFRRFGKGRHPAALNIGDCFSYALATQLGAPLLFKGGDFARTDIEAA